MTFTVEVGETIPQRQLLADLVAPALPAQRYQLHARHLPRARRHRQSCFRPTLRIAAGGFRCSATRWRSITEFDPLTGRRPMN